MDSAVGVHFSSQSRTPRLATVNPAALEEQVAGAEAENRRALLELERSLAVAAPETADAFQREVGELLGGSGSAQGRTWLCRALATPRRGKEGRFRTDPGVEAVRGRTWAESRTAALLGLRPPKAAGGGGCGTGVPGGDAAWGSGGEDNLER